MSGNIQLLTDVFAQAKAESRAVLIAYLPVGFPTVDTAIEAIITVLDAGADIVEVGLPHRTPGALGLGCTSGVLFLTRGLICLILAT
ncbi:tryptophan synthase subunit alpha [Actinocorallia sp. B10E7]|uniref:tryptophan synthase subunit alpha n=1 Tax=Actinocorallia sp. B10E7 TaxID=3153558 RepID=UPI00325DA016